MAQSSELTIEISGKSAHIARQEDGIDALDAGVQFVQRAYRMAKEFEPEQFRLLRFGRMQSGSARNAISAHTRLEGTLRTFSGSLHQALAQNLAEIARSLESELGCQISQHMSEGYPPVYNAPLLFDQVLQGLGKENLVVLEKPTLITEDFSFYQQRLPAFSSSLASAGEQPLHSDRFNFDEQLLEPRPLAFPKAALSLNHKEQSAMKHRMSKELLELAPSGIRKFTALGAASGGVRLSDDWRARFQYPRAHQSRGKARAG